MHPKLFNEEWAQAWCDEINASPTYRTSAATWEGAVALVMRADPAAGIETPRSVFLDLWHGECRGARVAAPFDVDEARYVIEAEPADWLDMLGGRTSPLVALMSGKLRLSKGNLTALLPYANAAKELIDTAALIHVRFPDSAA